MVVCKINILSCFKKLISKIKKKVSFYARINKRKICMN